MWIEHVVRALLSMVDRLVCLSVGRTIADGPPADVLARQDVREIFLGTDSTVAAPGAVLRESVEGDVVEAQGGGT
jgi:branched-chain amino acid transport system ATP-binding protein